MRYTTLGRSGLLVSAVCLGGNSWGAAGRRAWAPFGPAESRPFFRRALDLGITFFDTADVYNEGDSETIIGDCLLGYARRDDVVICTKVGGSIAGASPLARGLGRKHILASIDRQLKRLRTDHVDLYLMHVSDPVTPLEETLDAMTALVQAGKVRFIGASNQPAWKLAQMLMLADWKGYARPVALQNLFNLVQREPELDVHVVAREQGVALTPYSPNARGYLAGNRQSGTERARADHIAHGMAIRDCDDAVLATVRSVAAARGKTASQVALAWLWARGITAPVIGATRLEYLDDAAGAVDLALAPAEIEQLEAPYQFRAPPRP